MCNNHEADSLFIKHKEFSKTLIEFRKKLQKVDIMNTDDMVLENE